MASVNPARARVPDAGPMGLSRRAPYGLATARRVSVRQRTPVRRRAAAKARPVGV